MEYVVQTAAWLVGLAIAYFLFKKRWEREIEDSIEHSLEKLFDTIRNQLNEHNR